MKDAYYFSHDGNARNDPKIRIIRATYGWKGYGWFWCIVENMREQKGYKLDFNNKANYSSLVLELNLEAGELDKFITDCVDVGLFKFDGNFLYSESLLTRLEKLETIREKRREAIKKRWENQQPDTKVSKSDTNVSVSDTNVIQMNQKNIQSKEEYSKVKKSIVKKSNIIDNAEPADDDDDLTPPDFKQHKKLLSTWISAKKTHPSDIEFNALIDLAKQYGEMETRQAIAEAGKCKGDDFSVKYVTAILKNQKNGTTKGEKNNGTYTGFNQEEYERSAKEYQELINAKRAAQRN